MREQYTIAVIGAGAVGSATALALARDGRRVLLLDRDEPGLAGASFGNAGHIASELVRPLPSPALLFGFYRELFRWGGTLDLSLAQSLRMVPWIRRFATAAFRREANTPPLAALVRPAVETWSRWLTEIGRRDLINRQGHFEVAFGKGSAQRISAQAQEMQAVGVRSELMNEEALSKVRIPASATDSAGLWFPDSANLIDPLLAVRAIVEAAMT